MESVRGRVVLAGGVTADMSGAVFITDLQSGGCRVGVVWGGDGGAGGGVGGRRVPPRLCCRVLAVLCVRLEFVQDLDSLNVCCRRAPSRVQREVGVAVGWVSRGGKWGCGLRRRPSGTRTCAFRKLDDDAPQPFPCPPTAGHGTKVGDVSVKCMYECIE